MENVRLNGSPTLQLLRGISLETMILAGVLGAVIFGFAVTVMWPPDDLSEVPLYAISRLWRLSIPAYVVVQIIVLLRSSGIGRIAAALPLVVMIPIFVQSAITVAHESNLWFLDLYLKCPLALLYVTVVAFFVRPSAKPLLPATYSKGGQGQGMAAGPQA